MNKTILIVDDSEIMRGLIRSILERAGYKELVESDNGMTALDILKSRKVDLIITDWIMPGMTGIELLQIIRKNPDFESIPVLMLTVEALEISREAALAQGANGFLTKPFHVQDLMETVKMLLEGEPKDRRTE